MSNSVDKTVVANQQRAKSQEAIPPTADATVVQSVDAKTVVAGNPGMDSQPKQVTGQVASASEGMILKQRFELVELLGSGGMGAVYKARDLRQVEAGDADPWVAVKVINDNFARHEHALVSLQQETKKTQRLSHPNIVSAYDFDRDGDIAFMTMELLHGHSLHQLLQQNKTGLSESRALHILRQVTEAVSYAHQQGVVHADLKPANIFVTLTGQVKVLDFGIARAIYAESSAQQASSVQAFTPAYASINVLTGSAPDTKDDLFALGCIFYMLFTGEHPYRRCKATEADAAGMKAARIPALSRTQWKAISALLAFHPNGDLDINRFRNQFFGEDSSRSKQLAMLSVAALIFLVVGIVSVNWFNHREHREVIALLSATDTRSLEKAVSRLAEFNDDDKVVILDSSREFVLSNLQTQVNNLQSASDYQHTRQQLALMLKLYPDSSALMDLEKQFSSLRSDYVSSLAKELVDRIEQRRYQEEDPDFSSLLQALKTVEPDHTLFVNYDFRSLLAREAGLAVYLGHRTLAEAIVSQALVLFPEDDSEFKKVLSRTASSRVATAQSETLSASNDKSISEYEEAVNLAKGRDLTDLKQLEQFLGELQIQNPSMFNVVSVSLQEFIKTYNIRDPQLLVLKKSLVPVAKTNRQVVRRDPCGRSLANRGADSRYRCRDSLTATLKGPELVVVKGNRSQPTFAVSRLEVTVADYNHYCRLYRACAPRPDPGLPLTSINYSEAKAYAQWLSKMSGYQYSLPTLSQWELMAKDDSGVRDHNCKVYAGGRWIRGGALRLGEEGYQNSLGIKNLFGNASEWIRSGSGLWIAGGDADTTLDQCRADTLIKGGAEASPLRGFRVVRSAG